MVDLPTSIPTNRPRTSVLLVAACLCLACGCSITKSRLATEQLVVSDAVDSAIAQVDFSPLSGQTVFFDTKFLNNARLPGNSNVEYVISSLRQQMLAYDLRLAEKMEDAAIVVEARVGTLGNDGNEVTYGIPGNAALSTASIFLPSPVTAPTMPELSLGRRNHQWGAAKLGVFAYDRTSHERVWQAGVITGTSQARDLWVVGIGPFQRGRTYDKVRRGGPQVRQTLWADGKVLADLEPSEAYASQIDFRSRLAPLADCRSSAPAGVVPASAVEDIPDKTEVSGTQPARK
jgi:uncharacterized protein DUF6655